MTLYNRRGFLFWTLVLAALLFLGSRTIKNYSTHRSIDLESMIYADIETLSARNEIGGAFASVRNVTELAADPVAGVWTRNIEIKLASQPEPRFDLELFFISQTDDGLKAIVQYQFTDVNSGDTVQEFARYYDLGILL